MYSFSLLLPSCCVELNHLQQLLPPGSNDKIAIYSRFVQNVFTIKPFKFALWLVTQCLLFARLLHYAKSRKAFSCCEFENYKIKLKLTLLFCCERGKVASDHFVATKACSWIRLMTSVSQF